MTYTTGVAASAAVSDRGPGNGLPPPERKENGRAVAAVVSLELPQRIRSQSGLLALDRNTLVYCIGFCDHRSVAQVVATCWQARAHFPAPVIVRAQAFYLHLGAPARFVNSQLPTAQTLIRTEMKKMTGTERGLAVRAAAKNSSPASLAIINALLEGKNISEDDRGEAVVAAAESSAPASLAIINALLEGKNISEFLRGLAVRAAAGSGGLASLDIINALLEGKNISEDDRGWAVGAAARISGPTSLAIIDTLLKGRDISEEHRGGAIWEAARSSGPASLDIINALLKKGNILEDDRSLALIEAVKKRSAEIVGLLLPHGPIAMPKLREAKALAQELHEDSIITLLQSKLGG